MTVVYNQVMTYRVTNPNSFPDLVATQPLNTAEAREAYLAVLNDSNHGVLADITIVSAVTGTTS